MGPENRGNFSLDYQSMMYEGVVYPPFIKAEALNELREKHTLRSSDIVIATFPKCGTTWLQQIVLTLLNEADLEGANLRDANLTNTNFSEAILSEADLEGTLLVGTIFEDAEMPEKEIF